jgi:hypothetical protein
LTTALGLTSPLFFTDGTIRATTGNAANVFIGDSTVAGLATAGVFLKPEESFSISLNGKSLSTNGVYIIGTAADKINIILIS